MSPASLPTQHAAVLYGPKDLRYEQRTLYEPLPDQAQVAVQATGLCGSDLHYYMHGRNGDFALQAPLVLGHEAAGYITAVGSSVTDLTVGQRVAIEAGIMCKKCDYCSKGRYNLCKELRFASSAKTFPHLDGTLQERMNHPAHVQFRSLPDSCSFEQAALAEPLSVILHASRRAQLEAGQSVLVYGAGAIGLLACAMAKARGARRVVVVDINQARLSFAQENGFAQRTYCLPAAARPKTPEEQLQRAKESGEKILEALGGEDSADGFDCIFECTGAEPCIQMAIHTAITGGKLMLVGMGTRSTTLPLSAAALREVDIQGSFRYANTYPEALELLGSGKLPNLDKLVTHRFSLSDTAKAFDLLSQGVDEKGHMALKVVIGPSQ